LYSFKITIFHHFTIYISEDGTVLFCLDIGKVDMKILASEYETLSKDSRKF